MAKSKYAPALFEVINQQRNSGNKLGVPKWWKGLGRAGVTGATGNSSQPTGLTPITADTETTASESDANASNMPAETSGLDSPTTLSTEDLVGGTQTAPPNLQQLASVEDQTRERLFQIEGGRAWITLNTMQAAVVGGFLVAALVATFALGRLSKPSILSAEQSDSDVTKILAETPDSSVLKTASDKGDAAESKKVRSAAAAVVSVKSTDATSLGQDELKVGLCYVWLDTYERGDRASAEHVQKWLANTHGIQTILKPTSNSYRLFSKAGFDWSKPVEQEKCKQLSERIKSLGSECKRELNKANLRVYTFASPQIREITNPK